MDNATTFVVSDTQTGPSRTDLAVYGAAAVLILLSVNSATAKPALWVGGGLAFLAWVSAYQRGTLQTFAQNIL